MTPNQSLFIHFAFFLIALESPSLFLPKAILLGGPLPDIHPTSALPLLVFENLLFVLCFFFFLGVGIFYSLLWLFLSHSIQADLV